MMVRRIVFMLSLLGLLSSSHAAEPLVDQARTAMRKAATYYVENAATHGGYVYHYSLDLSKRWGEGDASKHQIWVQPPGTPTVGLALVEAYDATGDPFYLHAATDAAIALVYGQLKSGGWTNSIDFDPTSPHVAQYRRGGGGGKNNSSLDDGQTQSAILCLIRVDQANRFHNEEIHEAALIALDALLDAQFPNGGFPQIWTGPVEPRPVVKASYPEYDWRSEGRIKNYWDMYTLNDNVTGYIAETLMAANEVYAENRYESALRRLGDFLVLAQMPEPQPGWAQQYNVQMQPIWARIFEPPGVSGDETQEVLNTLMRIAHYTGDDKYLAPIPDAARWLRRSLLSDGRLARYYELKTNRPLYMERRGDVYELTYDDSDLPGHYGWITESQLESLGQQFRRVRAGQAPDPPVSRGELIRRAKQAIESLDPQGRWVSQFDGTPKIGQLKLPLGTPYLSSQVFSDNLSALAALIASDSDHR